MNTDKCLASVWKQWSHDLGMGHLGLYPVPEQAAKSKREDDCALLKSSWNKSTFTTAFQAKNNNKTKQSPYQVLAMPTAVKHWCKWSTQPTPARNLPLFSFKISKNYRNSNVHIEQFFGGEQSGPDLANKHHLHTLKL